MQIVADFFQRNTNPSDWEGLRSTTFGFDTLIAYRRFIDEVRSNVNTGGVADREFREITDPSYARGVIRRYGASKFGTTDESLVNLEASTYLFNAQLEGYLSTLRSNTINLDVIDIDQSKAIKFTDKEIGIFSFDLAALGLIKVFEYYSPVLKKIVNGNNVFTEKDADGKIIKDNLGKPVFFHKHKPAVEEHEIVFIAKEGGFFSPLLGRVVREDEFEKRNINGIIVYYFIPTKEIQKHIVERRHKVSDKGKPMWATTFKKVFIEIPKVEKSLPRIDIVVNASFGYNQDATNELIYSSMAAIAIAERLSRANVNYRIVAAFGCRTVVGGAAEKVFGFVNVKKEGEPLDKNNTSYLLSDGRYLRYLQFLGYIAMITDADAERKISDGIAAPINEKYSILKNNDDKFVIIDLARPFDSNNNLRPVAGQLFDTEEQAERYARTNPNRMSVNETKNAYIDMLANSTNPADRESAKRRDTKLVFTGATTMQEAENQYNLAIAQISRT